MILLVLLGLNQNNPLTFNNFQHPDCPSLAITHAISTTYEKPKEREKRQRKALNWASLGLTCGAQNFEVNYGANAPLVDGVRRGFSTRAVLPSMGDRTMKRIWLKCKAWLGSWYFSDEIEEDARWW